MDNSISKGCIFCKKNIIFMQKECGGGESLLLREAKRAKLKELSEIWFLQPLRIKLHPNVGG